MSDYAHGEVGDVARETLMSYQRDAENDCFVYITAVLMGLYVPNLIIW